MRRELTASPPVEKLEDFDHFAAKVKRVVLEPWNLTACNNTEIRIELRDTDYSIPKCVIHVDSSLHFSLHVFNWLLPEQHTIYTTCGQRINSAELSELLLSISNGEFKICESLLQDEYISSIAKDAVDETLSSSDVYRHSIPKCINKERSYGVLVVLRSAQCMILFNKDIVDDQVICEMCHKLQKRIFKQQSRKERQDKAPAKDKAPLAACGAKKLRATVIAQRLHCKDLEAKVKDLQSQIKKHGVSVSESLEKDLLTIMSGQNLEATPHMQFFWEQQMHLMRSTKMGRRYHPRKVKDLGMLLDPHLTYDKHIQALSSSCISKLGQIGRVKPNFDPTSQARAFYLRWAAAKTLVQAGHVTPPNLPKSGRFLISVLYAIKGGVA